MKRKELFEFEDFHWLPDFIRTSVTNLIIVFHKMMGTKEVIANLILDIQKKHHFTQITDLGSGSGGAMLDVIKQINTENENHAMELTLTDLYPNANLVQEINNRALPNVKYHAESVNATNIGDAPKGLKTMVASFHHMDPTVAKKILQSAQENKEPILIFELAKNNIPFIVWLIFLPISLIILFLMSWVMTLFVRPLSFTQILFTYPIPIIPIIYAWDGQASLMRTYTFDDVKSMIDLKEDKTYKWEIGDAKKSNGKNLGYFIIGYPKNENV